MSIQVSEQAISVALPSTSVKMLMVQPYLEFETPLQEPFPLLAECSTRLAQAIDTVFEIARTFDPHIMLFPEFGLPGVDAVAKVAAHMATAAVPSSRILIAGVRGLSKTEYAALCALPYSVNVEAENAPDQVTDAQWVNTSVTFVKDDAGALSLWIQPKISPSWPEENVCHQRMFAGRAVRVFNARFDNGLPCRFFSLLCYDWVGREAGAAVLHTILEEFDQLCRNSTNPRSLQWVFVLQHNPTPNHVTFLTAAHNFLSLPDPAFVQRHDAAVVMVCTANAKAPARSYPYGYSSFIFGPRAPFDSNGCAPTFATQSSRLRESAALQTCKDSVFREMGECIHTVEVRVPGSVVPNATDRTAALVEARTFPLSSNASVDPRIPGGPVPAVVKWVNDELDMVTDGVFSGTAIEPDLKAAHARTVKAYRNLKSQVLAVRVDGACAKRASTVPKRGTPAPDPAADIDTAWDADERNSLQHVIQTLALIGGVTEIDALRSQLHGRYDTAGVEVAAIRGSKHSECVPAFRRLAEKTHSSILFVSRDDNNLPILPREFEAFTDPGGGRGIRHTDAQTLLANVRDATAAEYRAFIMELLNVPDRSII
jgi:hypothetical protein